MTDEPGKDCAIGPGISPLLCNGPPRTEPKPSFRKAIKAMLSFFTIFRINVGEDEIRSMESKFHLAPIIGFLMGAAAFAVCLAASFIGLGSALTAAIVLALMFLLTKFLHFDGLADFGDGMVATGAREKHIKALKDTAIGAGGLGVAFAVTLITFAAMVNLDVMLVLFVWPAEILVKNAMVCTAAFGEPGNGMAAEQVRRTTLSSAVKSTALSIILCAAAVYIASFGDMDKFMLLIGIVAFMVALSILAGMFMARAANKHFGFVNGDILGAANEVARGCIFLFLAVLMAVLSM